MDKNIKKKTFISRRGKNVGLAHSTGLLKKPLEMSL